MATVFTIPTAASIMMVNTSPAQSATRRQVLRRIPALGASLAVGAAVATSAGALPAADAPTQSSSEFKPEERPMPDIKHLIKIRSTPESVYQAIARAEGIRNWWTRDASIEPKVGANGEMSFYGKRFGA